MEYSKLASGKYSVTSTGLPQSVVIPFIPNFIEVTNVTEMAAASGGVSRAWWLSDMGQGAAAYVATGSGPADGSSYITSGGFSTFAAGYPQLGNTLAIASISKHASAPVVTTTASHGLSTGNVVIMTGLYQSSTTGMPQIAGIPFVIAVTAPTTFTIGWNTNQTNYTALSGSPAGAVVRQVLYPYLYFPGDNVVAFISTGTTTTITTTMNHNLVVGSEVAFRIPSAWGTTQLNTPSQAGNFGFPVYGFVTAVNSAVQFVCNINSTGFTAFNSNVTFAQTQAGLTAPQVLAVGDNNTGSATNAYLPVTINPISIGGAFQNNSSQGFTVGGTIVGTAADVVLWRAYAHDLSL